MTTGETALNDEERQLLDRVLRPGASITNPRLIAELQWDSDRYYRVRDRLVDLGYLELGRGRGGVVRRVVSEPLVSGEEAQQRVEVELAEASAAVARESDLYPLLTGVIETDWAKDHRIRPLAVEVTALQGRRDTGGRYTRPDITAVEVRTYRYLPGKTLEVITFEVKPQAALDATCVYEALAHRQAATMSYVLLHVPKASRLEAELEVIETAAVEHGIGMVVVEDPTRYETWDTRARAVRHEPDPARLDQFIHTQLSEGAKERIRMAIR